MCSLLDNISKCVCDSVREKLGLEDGAIPLIKRNKTLRNGDFQIPLSGLQKLLGPSGINTSVTTQIEEKLCQGSFDEYVCKSNVTEDKLFLSLQRPMVFQEEICRILINKDPWTQDRKLQTVLVNAQFNSHGENDLSLLRTSLISQHIAKLLEVNGHKVECNPPLTNELDHLSTLRITSDDANTACSLLYERMKSIPYIKEDEENSLTVDYKEFMQKRQLLQGKDQYDKNIQKGYVTMEDEKLKILSCVENIHRKCHVESICIHVTAANFSFTMQQIDILWQMMGSSPKKQFHMAHGPVVTKTANAGPKISAEEFMRIREEETRRAFEMKYGNVVAGEKWMGIIKELSCAAIKFDLLSTSCKHTVKLDVRNSEDGEVENRAGVFVMYNYARLATLMQRFAEAVSSGTYPPIPEVTEINFSLLKEEGEWELMFNYVCPYSNLLKECVPDLVMESVKPNIHTHKICQFLLDLSRDLSSYYSRVHVLGESLPHLFPQMYARLSLLQTVKKVMEHGLKLLNISPISQL